jgi:hypothetical protein
MEIKSLKWKLERNSPSYKYWKATTPISEFTVSAFKPDDDENWIVSYLAFQSGVEYGIGLNDSKKFPTVGVAMAYAEKSHIKHVAKVLKKLVTQ